MINNVNKVANSMMESISNMVLKSKGKEKVEKKRNKVLEFVKPEGLQVH
jgi:hypothetical protein